MSTFPAALQADFGDSKPTSDRQDRSIGGDRAIALDGLRHTLPGKIDKPVNHSFRLREMTEKALRETLGVAMAGPGRAGCGPRKLGAPSFVLQREVQ
jgi:hypothetical protein